MSGNATVQGRLNYKSLISENHRELELSVSSTHILWRRVGDINWNNLIALSTLKGSTPQKGTDYFTSADISQITSGILSQLQISSISGLQNALDDKIDIVEDPTVGALFIANSSGGIECSDKCLSDLQETISDLSTIRAGAALGATALQQHQSLEDYATKQYVSQNGGKIDKISVNGTEAEIVDKEVDITVPTKVSDLTNDSGYLTQHQSLSAYRTSADQDIIDGGKQATISDLSTIRSGAALGATAVQPESGKGLFSGSYDDLSDKPTIPSIEEYTAAEIDTLFDSVT